MKRLLLFAVAAVVAAGCATPEPMLRSQEAEPLSRAGPAATAGTADYPGVPGCSDRARSGWTPFRDYAFSPNSDEILQSDGNKAWEIAESMKQNPSLRAAVDGLNALRASSVRDALLNAGVPADRILTGAYGNPQLRRENRVMVLFGC